MNPVHYDMVIVGAGLSGLTAASYLTKAGYRVLILEKSPSCGGLLNSFTKDGFVFDAGARSIENSGIIKPMLKDLGIELQLLESPVSIGIESSIIGMESKQSIDQYRHTLETLYPEHREDVQKIFQVIDKTYREMDVIYGFENPVFKNFRQDRRYLFKELLPWMGRFILAILRMDRMQKPIESYLAGLTSNQSLADLVAQHFFKRTPTFFALGYFYVYLDYLYPKGGTGKLPQALVKKIRAQGGEIAVATEVSTIRPAEKTVSAATGQQYTYDKLLWCADLKSLYHSLDTRNLPVVVNESIAHESKRIFASRGGDSVFSLFLGVDKPPKVFANITHGHLFYTPSRQGLGETHLSELKKLLVKGKTASKKEILVWVDKYCSLTTYEISIPSLRDPDLSPYGKTGLVVSFLLEYDLVKLVSETHWYDEFKRYLEESMIKVLDRSIFHGLLNSPIVQFSSSPMGIEKRFGSSEGGITGWTFELPSPVVNKLPKIASSVKTPIPDIYQCGQWAYSPAGIPTAILTGWYAADTICTQEKKKQKA